MTATPGSVAPTVSEPRYVRRFGGTERTLHWAHASAFFAMLATGLVLYLPGLAAHIGSRPLLKALHLAAAVAWLLALALIATLGDRRALCRTRRELERFGPDDARWLRGRRAPQGRFNAGQKVHAIIQAAFSVLFVVSGTLLWLGERNTALRLSGTIVLHDGLMYLAVLLVLGHIYLALFGRSTRPALRGMVRGTVDAGWAREHHSKWTPPLHVAPNERPLQRRAIALSALLIIGAGIGGTALVQDALDGGTTSTKTVGAAHSAAPPRVTAALASAD
ncbi:MAG: cytochrome b/b6 domain-containing protein [Solirubrobacteraceae bacterium]